MSVEEQINGNIVFDNSKTNLLKFDMPIGRKKYFIISLIIGGIMLTLGLIMRYLEVANALIPSYLVSVFIFVLFLLYLTIINDAKRFWDISEQRNKGLMFAIGLFLLNIILFFTSLKFISFVIYVCMILVRGKVVK